MPFFVKGAIDEESAITLEKCPLVEELNLKIQRSASFSHIQFQLRHYRSLFNFDPNFLIYGPFDKERTPDFL